MSFFAICNTCTRKLSGSATTKLQCGHYFHLSCVANYYIIYEQCPICEYRENNSTIDCGTSEVRAEFLQQMFFKKKPSEYPPSINADTLVGASNTYNTIINDNTDLKRGGFDKFVNSVKTLFGTTQTKEIIKFFRSEPLKTSEQLQTTAYSAKNLVENGINIDDWVNMGYKIEQLKFLKITKEDLDYMGFNGKQLVKYKMKEWVNLLKYLNMDFKDLLIRNISIQDLENSDLNKSDVNLLKGINDINTFLLLKNISLKATNLQSNNLDDPFYFDVDI
ncbi:hypothetical protein EON71_00110 [bacterium]|nr:MAG: hypothetical protein EON71_00110 [bacterium]